MYPKQLAIIESPERFTICEATTKAGKTFSHIEWLIDVAESAAGGNHWWVAPTYSQAKMAYRRTKDRLLGYITSGQDVRLKIADQIPFVSNESELYIRVFGSFIWFKTAEKPDNLYGEDVHNLVGDEITRWREEAWHACYSTLAATTGRAKLIGNVKGRRNFAYKLARKAESGESDWSHHLLTALDAIDGGVISSDTVDAARRDMPEAVFNELFMAKPSDDEGNPFGITAINSNLIDEPTGKPVVAWGWDLAKSVDWTAGVGLDRNGDVAAIHRFQNDWERTEIFINTKVSDDQNTLIDSTGVGDPIVERLQKDKPHIEGFKFTASSKQQLMEGLASYIQRGCGKICKGVLQTELEAYEYEYTRTGVKYSAPDGMHDDTVCAYALAVKAFKDVDDLSNVIQIREL